jgi:hypothetical protein
VSDDQARRPGESFLAHRARLKSQRQREPEPAPVSQAIEEAPAGQSAAVAEPDAQPLTDADMPPLESLTAESDFTQFLAEGVSDALRRAALRKLFHLPEFNILDGMNDYDEDYTNFEKLGEVVTYHQRRMREREEAEKAAAEQEAQRADAETADEQPVAGEVSANAPAEEAGAAKENQGADTADGSLEDDGDLEA